MDIFTIIIILICIIALWFIGKMFAIPIKAIFKLIINSIFGGLLILIINLIGSAFQFHIGLNIFTSILVGILGIPRRYFINYPKTIFVDYSTVTDFAKFLGLSTSSPLCFEM